MLLLIRLVKTTIDVEETKQIVSENFLVYSMSNILVNDKLILDGLHHLNHRIL